MNVAEQLHLIVNWLNNQNESLSFGLQNVQDAIKLYNYWQDHDFLPEYADEDSDDEEVSVSMHRMHCLGYDPLG